MNIKDQDYKSKRDIVRSAFAGDNAKSIEGIVDIDVMRYMNVVLCVDVMRRAGYSSMQIQAQFERTARDGYSAMEIITTGPDTVELVELDPATLVPRMEGANGDYRHTFVQYIGTDEERILAADDVMYMAMPYTFNSIIDTIDKGL